MPTYDYRCNQCGMTTEMRHGVNHEPSKICPECGEVALTRIIGTPDFILKGTGWARDGYKNNVRQK